MQEMTNKPRVSVNVIFNAGKVRWLNHVEHLLNGENAPHSPKNGLYVEFSKG